MSYHNKGGVDPVGLKDKLGLPINPATEDTLVSVAGMITSAYDYFSITRTSGYITSMIFKTGGSGGTTVATITIARDIDNYITSITKT
jgi:hypothetical protein